MKKNFLKTSLVGLAALLLPALGSSAPHLLMRNASPAATTDLVYQGNKAPVMIGNVNVYYIFWTPKTFQDGSAVPAKTVDYEHFINGFIADFLTGNGLSAIASQYYQNVKRSNTYVSNKLFSSGSHVSLTTYPLSGCPESTTSTVNCLEDSDIRAELQHVIKIKKWSTKNSIFLIYTPNGEDVCDGNGNCTSTGNAPFCGYHNFIPASESTPALVYAVIPFTGANGCGTGTYPQNSPDYETSANTSTLEIFGMLTNPMLNAWLTPDGREIGDLCQGVAIPAEATWANGMANHQWNGHSYNLQPLYDNHVQACTSIGY